jgi:hypothetical protein
MIDEAYMLADSLVLALDSELLQMSELNDTRQESNESFINIFLGWDSNL